MRIVCRTRRARLAAVEGLEDVGVNLATESAQFTATADKITAAVAKLDDLVIRRERRRSR